MPTLLAGLGGLCLINLNVGVNPVDDQPVLQVVGGLRGIGNSVAVDPFPAIPGGATQDKDVGMGGGGIEAEEGGLGGWSSAVSSSSRGWGWGC